MSLTPVQKAMFKAMIKSLSIPHFGYSEEIDLTALKEYRQSINEYLSQSDGKNGVKKISYMPIFIKALSKALNEYPLLNACLVNSHDPNKVQIQYRSNHNVGIAMDTPTG